MSNEVKKNYVIVLGPNTDGITALLVELRKRENLEILETNTMDEAVQTVNQFTPCMLVANLCDNQSVPSIVTLLKRVEKGIKYGLLKTMVVSKIKNKQIGNLISGLGVTDYIEEPIPARTILFKANIQLKSVEAIRKREEDKKSSKEKTLLKKGEEGKDQGNMSVTELPPPNKRSALELAMGEDTFLFKNGTPKKHGKKMVLEMGGPPPESGDWVEHEAKPDGQSSWRWVPKDENGKPIPAPADKDGWVHEGDKPQFSEASGKWQMVSEKPDLSLYKNKTKAASKVSTDANGNLEVAEDSKAAEEVIEAANKKFKRKKKPEKAAPELSLEKKEEEKKAVPTGPKFFENDTVKNAKEVDLKALNNTEKQESHDFRSTEAIKEEAKEALLKDGRAPTEATEPPETVALKNKKKKPKKDKTIDLGEEAHSDALEETAESSANTTASAEEEKTEEDDNPALSFLKKKKSKELKMKDLEALPEGAAHDFRSAEAILEEKNERELKDKRAKEEANKKATEEEETEEVEEIDPTTGKKTKKLKTKKKKNFKDKLDALNGKIGEAAAQDDASAAGVSGGSGAEDKKKKKKDLLSEIQAELNKPVDENISDEEFKEEAKKMGLDPAKTSKKEVGKKRRLDKLEALKNKLKNMDEAPNAPSPEEAAPEPVQHDLSTDEAENTWSKNGELGSKKEGSKKEGSKFNARDSDLAAEEEDADGKIASLKNKEKNTAKKEKKEQVYFYRTAEELKLTDAAWEKTENHFVFLSGNIRYHGFESIEKLLPLWVYSGPKVPDFIAKESRWRFAEQDAKCCNAVSDVPFEVVDFLNAINAQVKQDDVIAKAKEKVAALEEAREEKDAQVQAERKKTQSAAAEKLAKLKDKLGDAAEAPEETPAAAEEPVEDSAGESDDSLSPEKKEKKKKAKNLDKLVAIKAKLEAANSELAKNTAKKPEEKAEGTDAISFDPIKDKKSADKKKRADKLAALKEKLERSEAVSEEDFTEAMKEPAEEVDLEEDKKKTATIKEAKPKNETKATEKLIGDLGEKSKNIKDFLEKRKEKAKNSAPVMVDPSKGMGSLKGFLGLSVAISDAIYEGKTLHATANKFSSLIALSIGNCFVFLTEKQSNDDHLVLGSTNLLYAPNATFREDALGANRVQTMIYHEVKIKNGDKVENLGYLILEPCNTRTEFTYIEIESLKKVAEMLANYWNDYKKAHGEGTTEGNKAA